MSIVRSIQNLALIGFMGTGKSSVGHIVAEALHYQFIDTDHAIEEMAGMTVAAVFAQAGESAFRELEHRLVLDLASKSGLVIATGGGLAASEANLASLKTHALVVCLWASPETIWERVREHTHRPLLSNPDPMGKIRELLAVREPFYRQADVLINAEQRPLREVAAQVVHQFHEAKTVNA